MERLQYDISLDSQRAGALVSQGASQVAMEELKSYLELQLITDIGERVDRAESHYVYQIREGKLYGAGLFEPFVEVMERGILQRWEGSRENAELTGYRFVQEFMADSSTPDGATIFNPSPPDGRNYNKNYLDVYKKVGNEVHTVRYFSDLSNEEYREKILQINPAYAEVIPQNPTDVDFFVNPVIVPTHLDLSPDHLAEFILGGKKGMGEQEFSRIISENTWILTSTINTLVENPWAILEHQKNQKALYAGVRRSKDGEKRLIFQSQKMEIKYLEEQEKTLGGGGCGSGACSTGSPLSVRTNFESDLYGDLSFNCPSCGKENIRQRGTLMKECGNPDCTDPKSVLPPGLRN